MCLSACVFVCVCVSLTDRTLPCYPISSTIDCFSAAPTEAIDAPTHTHTPKYPRALPLLLCKMVGSLGRAALDPYGVNMPLMGICFTSLLFNTTLNGRFIAANMYTNLGLLITFGVSNGCYGALQNPLWGAQTGLLGSLCFTFGVPLRLLFTSRLFPRYVHYGIGSFYCTYHSLQWRNAKVYFEDANEDDPDERF